MKKFKILTPYNLDVVYTWVNGSDPLFLDGLKHAKEKLRTIEADSRNRHPEFKTCPYENCIPSHYFTTSSLPKNVKSELIRSQNPFLSKELIDVKDQVINTYTYFYAY